MSVEAFQIGAVARSGWYRIDQSRIDAFADVTEDWQYIHLDAEKAAKTALGSTVAHGFLTLSMLSAMSYEVTPDMPGAEMGLNYGFDRIRFVHPVKAGQRIRGLFEVTGLDEEPGRLRLRWQVTVEIEGEERPALVADWLNIWILKHA